MDETHDAAVAIGADPLESILAQMYGKTITCGYDVVCAMEADLINDLLAQQYVAHVKQGTTLPPINATVPVIENISVQFIDLTLGPPLISFDPSLDPGDVILSINFISGLVYTVQTSGDATTLLGTQLICPGDQYSLTGVVPLTSVSGSVQANHDVVLDIANGSKFTSHLNLQGTAETTLGQYFLGWLQNNIQNFQYKLGTLVCTPGGTDLTPAGTFQFATQFDATDSNDKGRLLMFIPTTYNPAGGSQTSLPIADIIPEGYSAALIVSSQVLFANILQPFFQNAFVAYGVTVSASPAQGNSELAYTLQTEGGKIVPCIIDYYDRNDNEYVSGTGSGMQVSREFVFMPFPKTTIESNRQGHISIAGSSAWDQSWAKGTLSKWGMNYTDGTVGMHATASAECLGAVDSGNDIITFTGTPSVGITFDNSSIFDILFGSGGAANVVGQQIVDGATPVLEGLFSFKFPQVNAFAVSNLLFPAQHILSLKDVYVPGDLVIFGDVQKQGAAVTPVQVVLGPGQTQQFTASGATSVTWTAQLGTISSSGRYTAPPSIRQAQTDVISANGVGAAVVTLVPGGVLVSPSFAYMVPSDSTTEPQQFIAAGAGVGNAGVTWTMFPQRGTISFDGLYTPPWSDIQGLQAVTITAASKTDPTAQGVALVVLAETNPANVAVTPFSVSEPLTPGQTQQFTADVIGSTDQSVTWSILPAGIGTISASGVYQAPAQITAPQPVLVVATSDVMSSVFGTALVTIAPA
ncbi:MAG: hypothetical protein IT391_00500 [Nitrospira sp.]|nr:hypothetical protein [Nitrospira sp.]